MKLNLSLSAENREELGQILERVCNQNERNDCPICGQHKLWKYGHEKDCALEKWIEILTPEKVEKPLVPRE